MELRQLKYFIRIVELNSFSKAARDLFIAQPALSNQIANLEQELKIKLLSRSARGVVPTETGKIFYRHANIIIRQIDSLHQEISNESSNPKGSVSIGIPTSVSNVLAGPLIAASQKRYPTIKLRVVEGLSGHLEELLHTGRVDISLLFDNPTITFNKVEKFNNSGLIKIPIVEEELFLQTTNLFSNKKAVSASEAGKLNLVLPGKSNSTRQLIDFAFAKKNIQLKILNELDSLSTIQSVVEDGLGATILSLSAFVGSQKNRKCNFFSIKDLSLKRTVSICHLNTMALSIASQHIEKLVLEIANQLVKNRSWLGAKAIPIKV